MLNLIKRPDFIILTLGSVALTVLSYIGVLPFAMAEVFGFVSGAACVWLVVKQNIWSWPLGIINNIFFIYLFFGAALYADMGLQFWYVAASLYGWYFWLNGGANKTKRAVSNIGLREAAVVLGFMALATFGMREYLISVGGAAPLLDGITTALSLGAFWMQAKKYVQSWYLWIAADLIYIPLYIWKDLPLTGILYIVFLAMCIVGLRDWRRELNTSPDRAAIEAETKELLHA
jgi:nicotinamide mononucleotide transporter